MKAKSLNLKPCWSDQEEFPHVLRKLAPQHTHSISRLRFLLPPSFLDLPASAPPLARQRVHCV
eukprot:5487199-Pyramimonas_sp.AAC.1